MNACDKIELKLRLATDAALLAFYSAVMEAEKRALAFVLLREIFRRGISDRAARGQ